MYGEIITTGNELTSGKTQDLNSWYAAGRLTASGLRVTRITTVGDDLEIDLTTASVSKKKLIDVTLRNKSENNITVNYITVS